MHECIQGAGKNQDDDCYRAGVPPSPSVQDHVSLAIGREWTFTNYWERFVHRPTAWRVCQYAKEKDYTRTLAKIVISYDFAEDRIFPCKIRNSVSWATLQTWSPPSCVKNRLFSANSNRLAKYAATSVSNSVKRESDSPFGGRYGSSSNLYVRSFSYFVVKFRESVRRITATTKCPTQKTTHKKRHEMGKVTYLWVS